MLFKRRIKINMWYDRWSWRNDPLKLPNKKLIIRSLCFRKISRKKVRKDKLREFTR